MSVPQKYTVIDHKPLRWHDGQISMVGPNSIVETDPTNIVALGGVSYVAMGSQVNVLLNSASPIMGIGTTLEDTPVASSP